MAIFKWNNTVHMSEEEIKELSEEKKAHKQPPTPIDLSTAERISVNKADLKIQEIQAEQE